MREIKYKTFSLKFHRKNWQNKKPNICQFELTFGCGLHCRHCYSDCYNKPRYIKKELGTKEVKFILDRVFNQGILWLCFTGGDPLTRPDFLELYLYAKNKGFIVTIFTNAYSMNKKIADCLKDRPPFAIEITLNAVSRDLYEKISQVKGSFARVMRGIELILKAKLPLKIKADTTKYNLRELPKIRSFVEGLGLKFKPNVLLHNRLDGDFTPANLRISPQEVLSLDGNKKAPFDDCELLLPNTKHQTSFDKLRTLQRGTLSQVEAPNTKLFRCAITGGDGIIIEPFGNIIPCTCIREPKVNLLKEDAGEARKKILNWVRTRHITLSSPCQQCSIRNICYNCPGKAYLETGNLAGIVDWFCKFAHLRKSNIV